ncbi:MAG: LamG domain-containing protein [bacterium]|nr:LamG domain-containing protein [bacterium]
MYSKENLSFNNGEWLHIAVTWRKGDKVCLYLNGKLVGEDNYNWEPIPAADLDPVDIWKSGLWIGRSPEGKAEGAIDELRISDCIRKFKEINK